MTTSKILKTLTGILAVAALLWASGPALTIIPALVPAANKQGTTGTKFMIAGTVTGTTATLCTDADGNATTTGCSGSAGGFFLSGTTDPGVAATPTIVQSAIANAASVAYSGNVTSGNCSVVTVMCSFGSGGSLGTPTDTRGTSYGAAVNTSSFTSGGCCAVLMNTYLGTLPSSGANTVTSNSAGCDVKTGLSIMEVSGSTCTIDVVGQRVQNVNGPPAVTTTVTNDLLILSTSFNRTSGTYTVTPTSPAAIDQSLLATSQTIGVLGHSPTGPPATYTPLFVNDDGTGDASHTTAIRATPIGSPGSDGDFYLNRTTGILWGPKASGSWSESGLSLILNVGTAPALTSCGGSPAISGNDQNGRITIGSGATGCVATFHTAYASAPSCLVTSRGGVVFTYTTSTTALTLTNSGDLSSTVLDYVCYIR